jgi:hypothetical protein
MATNPLGRKRKPKKPTRVIVVEFVFSMLVLLYGAWMLMLAVGVAHHEWLPDLPTIDYGTSVLLVWMLSGVASATRRFKLDD